MSFMPARGDVYCTGVHLALLFGRGLSHGLRAPRLKQLAAPARLPEGSRYRLLRVSTRTNDSIASSSSACSAPVLSPETNTALRQRERERELQQSQHRSSSSKPPFNGRSSPRSGRSAQRSILRLLFSSLDGYTWSSVYRLLQDLHTSGPHSSSTDSVLQCLPEEQAVAVFKSTHLRTASIASPFFCAATIIRAHNSLGLFIFGFAGCCNSSLWLVSRTRCSHKPPRLEPSCCCCP